MVHHKKRTGKTADSLSNVFFLNFNCLNTFMKPVFNQSINQSFYFRSKPISEIDRKTEETTKTLLKLLSIQLPEALLKRPTRRGIWQTIKFFNNSHQIVAVIK